MGGLQGTTVHVSIHVSVSVSVNVSVSLYFPRLVPLPVLVPFYLLQLPPHLSDLLVLPLEPGDHFLPADRVDRDPVPQLMHQYLIILQLLLVGNITLLNLLFLRLHLVQFLDHPTVLAPLPLSGLLQLCLVPLFPLPYRLFQPFHLLLHEVHLFP